MKIREIINYSFTITNPRSTLFLNDFRSIPRKYLFGELLWYFLGRNDLKFIKKYSKFWSKIANPDGTINSAYGYLLFNDKNESLYTEWEWAVESLLKDQDSRQSIIHFNKPKHMYSGNKDFPCTIYGIFHIRDSKLNFSIFMRSSDSIFGTTFDVPFFMLLQQQMWFHLKEKYTNLELGDFYYHSNSQHIYEKDFNLVENMLCCNFYEENLQLTSSVINTNGTPKNDILELFSALTENKEYSSSDDFLRTVWGNLEGV